MTKKPMTHDLWMRLDGLHWKAAREDQPTADMLRLRRKVTTAMEATFGPCPSKLKGPARPPWYLRLGLKLLVKKFVKEDTEMKITPLLSAIGFALAAGLAAAQTAGADGVISGLQEWLGIAGAAFSAGWAALKNPKKAISLKD